VSLKNYGGFASVRRRLTQEESLNAKSIKLVFNGDGRDYKIRFRLDGNLDGPAYETTISTLKGEKVELILNEAQFEAIYRSRLLRGYPKFNFSEALQIEFMLADKKEGEFELTLYEFVFLK